MRRAEYQPGQERLAREKEDLGQSVGKVIKDLSLADSVTRGTAIEAVISAAAANAVRPPGPLEKGKVSSEDYEKVRAIVGEEGADLDLSGESDVAELLKARETVILQDEIDDIDGIGLSGLGKVKRAVEESTTLTKLYTGVAALQTEFLVPMVLKENPLSIPYGVFAGFMVYQAVREETRNREVLKEKKGILRTKKEEQIVDLRKKN